jgi:Na+/phosphate symporter
MQRMGYLAMATLLSAALALPAQQAVNTTGDNAQKPAVSQSSPVDEHMKMLNAKLELTTEQQARLRPIVAEMIDTMAKLKADPDLTQEDRMAGMKQCVEKADREARVYLSDDQKRKLDQLESDMRGEPHGSAS